MSDHVFSGRSGAPVTVSEQSMSELRRALRGPSLVPGDAEYDRTRAIWNAMIDRRPALIARCTGAEDVARCVRFARRHEIVLTVRGGGHNIGGRALADGGLLVDLSELRRVDVDVERELAHVGPGATLHDLDAATRPHGMVVPSGIVSETGVAGLTLGGGFGWLSRRWGLTCDHLVGVEMVTADGDVVEATDITHSELMWGLRGGGGGFGIVTAFRFQMRRLPDPVTAGMIVFRDEDRAEAMARVRACAANAPDELGCLLRLGAAPPAPFLASELHGQPIAIVVPCHTGSPEAAERDLAPLRADGRAVADLVAPRSFIELQSMFDAGEAKGRRDYWKSEYVTELDDELAEILLEASRRLPSPSANIKLFQLGGAVARSPVGSTSAGHRDARAIVVIASSWDDPADDGTNIAWVQHTWRLVHDRSGRGGYLNFLTEDAVDAELASSLAGVDLERLGRIRRTWDSDGVFAPPGSDRAAPAVTRRGGESASPTIAAM
ncbi:MAG: FAD-binding oxidoreductase [Thermoanaerobaculales bacterium]|nr:FAD-binding oxidoreductase [Thermoanaerobaculales bacterium]